MSHSLRRAVSLYDACDLSGRIQRGCLTQARWHAVGQKISNQARHRQDLPATTDGARPAAPAMYDVYDQAKIFVAAGIEGLRVQRAHCGLLAPWPTVPAAIHTYPVWSAWPGAVRQSLYDAAHFARDDVMVPLGRAVAEFVSAIAEDRFEAAVKDWVGLLGQRATQLGALLTSGTVYRRLGTAILAGLRHCFSWHTLATVVRGTLGPHGISILLGCILEGVVGRGRFINETFRSRPDKMPFDEHGGISAFAEAREHMLLGRADDASYGLVGRVFEKQLVLAAIQALCSGKTDRAVWLIRTATLARLMLQPIRVISCILVGCNAVLCGVAGTATFTLIRAADWVCTSLNLSGQRYTGWAATTIRARIETLTSLHPTLDFPTQSAWDGTEGTAGVSGSARLSPIEQISPERERSNSVVLVPAFPRDFSAWVAGPHDASEAERKREREQAKAEQERREAIEAGEISDDDSADMYFARTSTDLFEDEIGEPATPAPREDPAHRRSLTATPSRARGLRGRHTIAGRPSRARGVSGRRGRPAHALAEVFTAGDSSSDEVSL